MDDSSPLAVQTGRVHPAPPRTRPVFGLAVHMSGTSEVDQALRHGADPLKALVTYYLDPDAYFPAYVIGYDGTIVQICLENQKASHIGFDADDHAAFLDGSWRQKLPGELVALWHEHWPGYASPAHLFPGPSPNDAYVGVEVLPLTSGICAQPMAPGLRHTLEQHQAVVDLGRDVAERWEFPSRWHRTGRLVGHEDVNPLQRTTMNPPAGWDPGYLRPAGSRWFDFAYVRAELDPRDRCPEVDA